jgi:DNA-binding transcriptional regulator YhcF (GntR family)
MVGLYVAGERLPSVRELADELGSNRNTVNKAYQNLLGLGVIEAGDSSRKGFRVKGLAGIRARHGLPYSQHFYAQVTKLVWEGMAAGMSAAEVSEASARAVQEVYKRGALRLAFYECNELDSREMGGHLSGVLNADIACGVLSDFQERTFVPRTGRRSGHHHLSPPGRSHPPGA